MTRDPDHLDAERTMARLKAVLSEIELEVLLLCTVERLSEREAAQVVHRSEQAVHALLARAKRKAREVLAADEHRQEQR